jgi:tetratricopeptide (TPR) repeat protein
MKAPDESSFTDLQNIKGGDIIGFGVSGSKNIIGKDINIVINEAQSYGLNLLYSNYFIEHKSTQQDLEDWKNGFSFKLESIKEKMELRRNIVDNLKIKLEKEHRLLIIGESGTSKSTILMEIMSEYFDCGFQILYSFGEIEIKNGPKVVEFIEEILKGNNKVLIAIDNVHSERTSAIFHVIDKLSNYKKSNNLLFVLTARNPEFDWFVNDRLNTVEELYRQSIRKFIQIPQYRYNIEAFTKADIENFIEKYQQPKQEQEHLQKQQVTESILSKEKLSDLATKIFDNTKGHPIMVKFYVFGKGLEEDVQDRYYRYLFDQSTSQNDIIRTQTMLVCSLLDIGNIPITDKLLEEMNLLSHAYNLEHALLYQQSEGLWKTIHPRWDMELLFFLYNVKNKGILSKRIEYLKTAIDSIFNVSNEYITATTIQTLYDIASFNNIPINVIKTIIYMPDYLSNKTKCNLYIFAIVPSYRRLQMYPETLNNCNKALELEPNNVDILNLKTLSLIFIKRYDEALECSNRVIKLNPNDASVWMSKGLIFQDLKKDDEALECWKKAVDIDDNYVNTCLSNKDHFFSNYMGYNNSVLSRLISAKLSGKGIALEFLKRYDEALECSNKALELDSKNLDNINIKSWALNGLKRYDEALECSNKALELDSKNAWSFTNKSWALNGLKRYDEALECSNKALELNQSLNNFSAFCNKATALNGLKRYDEALECSNKALELDSRNEWGWLTKAIIYNSLKRYDEALECSNKALELDSRNDWSWNAKAWTFNSLGKYDEALECSNKALELDLKNAWSFTNKSNALLGLKRYDEALECSNKALELDSNVIPPCAMSFYKIK